MKMFQVKSSEHESSSTVSEAKQAVNIKVEDTIETRLEESEALS